MNIRDIVNRGSVNLQNCESEPIHIPGSIQQHGFLLGLKTQDHIIDICSANCGDYIPYEPQALLGKPLREIIPQEEADSFSAYLQQSAFDAAHPHVFTIGGTPYNTNVHVSGDTIVAELEPFPDGSLSLPNLYSQTRKFVSFLEASDSLISLCGTIASETRAITGYDRVMIYRFDKDYNGAVIAEDVRKDLQPFLGQHYPHTDIPAQARELYLRNLLRLIADVDYQPVPLLTPDDGTKSSASLDLSLSVLRSVSPIHIEYLKNMGVQATLTISLVLDGKLWGLIACHHYTAKNLPHYTRLAAQLQGHFLTSQIKVREAAAEYKIARQVEDSLQTLLPHLLGNEGSLAGYVQSPDLLLLANAEGVAILHAGKIYTNGKTPAADELTALEAWLAKNISGGGLHTSRLIDLYPHATAISDTAAGIIYHALSAAAGECIIWFLPETEQAINWAGNPNKAVLQDESGMRLTPRKSFDLYLEVVKNQSREWCRPELAAAASFAHTLQKQFHLFYLASEEDRYRRLSVRLQAANEELANINWISTHDLKEPLRKIQIFASRILEKEIDDLPGNVRDAVTRMQSAAARMQSLLDDILLYAHTNTGEKRYTTENLSAILKEVTAAMAEELEAKHMTIVADQLPDVPVIAFQVRQLFFNLIGNAIKFSKGDAPQIRITCEKISGSILGQLRNIAAGSAYYRIAFADNGIGFDAVYAEKIFEVFQRLHGREYSGTGIGLAIAKKVMDNHHGAITGSGEEGKGATFTVYFPVPQVA